MAQIYKLSFCVFIWLGETENDSDYVMDCITIKIVKLSERDDFWPA